MSNDLTTLVIKKSTRQALKHLARKDQTYDQLLNELLKKEVTGPQTQQQVTQQSESTRVGRDDSD